MSVRGWEGLRKSRPGPREKADLGEGPVGGGVDVVVVLREGVGGFLFGNAEGNELLDEGLGWWHGVRVSGWLG